TLAPDFLRSAHRQRHFAPASKLLNLGLPAIGVPGLVCCPAHPRPPAAPCPALHAFTRTAAVDRLLAAAYGQSRPMGRMPTGHQSPPNDRSPLVRLLAECFLE